MSKDGSQLIASLPLTGQQFPTSFIDVTDVDQDGVAEIVALYEGNATLAPVIYVYKTRLKNGKLKVRRKFTFSFPLGTGVGKDKTAQGL